MQKGTWRRSWHLEILRALLRLTMTEPYGRSCQNEIREQPVIHRNRRDSRLIADIRQIREASIQPRDESGDSGLDTQDPFANRHRVKVPSFE